jgi:hypothetical protein
MDIIRSILWMVNGFCTCGAQLPADARFCHKCGKPQYDLAVSQSEEPPVSAVPVSEPAKVAGVSFRNGAAVRTGIMVALLVSFLMALPMPPVLQAVWQLITLFAGGFLSVYLYGRRTGISLSVWNGARLGWITGVFCFLIMMVLFTISIFAIAAGEGLQAFFRQAVSARGTPEIAEQLERLLESPAGIAGMLIGFLLIFFFMLTAVPTAGGAVGAKVLEKE